MAHLGPGEQTVSAAEESIDRGQIILVAAFILAIAFVVLAVVVNSAIYTENLATRDDVAGSEEALEYRGEVELNMERLIEAANANESLGEPIDQFNDSLLNVSSQGGYDQAALGRVTNLSTVTWEEGIRIAQDDPDRNFTVIDDTGAVQEDWVVVEGVNQTRNFELNVTNPGHINLDFTIRVEDELGIVNRWDMTVENTGGDNVMITVEEREWDSVDGLWNLTNQRSCERTNVDEPLEIDITGGTVGGTPCAALYRLQDDGTPLWFANVLEDEEYDIHFEDSDTIEGTYSFVIDEGDPSEHLNATQEAGQAHDHPYKQDDGVIYSARVSFAYYTSAVGYETEIRAAPGELPP